MAKTKIQTFKEFIRKKDSVNKENIPFKKEKIEDSKYDDTIKISKAVFKKIKKEVEDEIKKGYPRKKEYAPTGYETLLKPLTLDKGGIVHLSPSQLNFLSLHMKVDIKNRNTRLEIK